MQGPSTIQQSFENLKQGTNGIWMPLTAFDERLSYPIDGNQECFQLEEESFWFSHRNKAIREIYQKFRKENQDIPLLDLGGGNGFVSKMFQEMGVKTILMEPGPEGARNAHARGVQEVICAKWSDVSTREKVRMDIGLFDVIEHIENPIRLLTDIHQKTSDDSYLFITVPAYQILWSTEDDWAGHFRRYSQKSLRSEVEAAGYQLVYATSFFTFLTVPIFLFRSIPHILGLTSKIRAQTDARKAHRPNSKFIQIISSFELWLTRKSHIPFGGSSILAVFKKLTQG